MKEKRKRRSKERKKWKRKDLPSKVKKRKIDQILHSLILKKNWQQKIQLIKLQLLKTFMRQIKQN